MVEIRISWRSLIIGTTVLFSALATYPSLNSRASAGQIKQDPLASAYRTERNGWIYVHLEGTPEEVGYQHGYLLAREINEALRVFKVYSPRTTKHDWQFYRESARELFWKKMGDEYQKEIEGIAKGANARGVKIDSDDVLAMNGWIELASYYVPSLRQASYAATSRPKRHNATSASQRPQASRMNREKGSRPSPPPSFVLTQLENDARLVNVDVDLVFLSAAEHPAQSAAEVKHSQQHQQKQYDCERGYRAPSASTRVYMFFDNPFRHL